MKELILVRHAKAEKADFGQDDHGRKLVAQGILAAKKLGALLSADARIPQVILASDSERTKETAVHTAQSLAFTGPLVLQKELYSAGVEDALKILAGRDEGKIMLVGHNPFIEEAVESFLGEYHRMRPAYAMWLRFEIDSWEELYARTLPESHHLYKTPGDE